MSSYYDVAQICLNGHVVNKRCKDFPVHNSNFCKECGAKTINKCPKCSVEIQGKYNVDGVMSFSEYEVPSYCNNCGEPYPWIEEKLRALDEIIGLMELSENEKEEFKESARNLTSDNPKTGLSIFKIKKFGNKAGQEMWGLAKDLIVQISTQAALKALGL